MTKREAILKQAADVGYESNDAYTARRAKARTSHSQGGWSIEVYKGYLIQPGLGGEMFYVQKGGVTIASCLTPDAARQAIDAVVGR